nr:MAG TPA: hypothetical protein [Bacteriophage sp.]
MPTIKSSEPSLETLFLAVINYVKATYHVPALMCLCIYNSSCLLYYFHSKQKAGKVILSHLQFLIFVFYLLL